MVIILVFCVFTTRDTRWQQQFVFILIKDLDETLTISMFQLSVCTLTQKSSEMENELLSLIFVWVEPHTMMLLYVLISLILVTSTIGSPAVTLYADYSIINGSLLDPDHSLGPIRIFGVLSTTKDCMKACLNVGELRCTSFSYYNSDYVHVGDGYTNHFYGVIDNPVWSLQVVMDAETGRILWPCRNDMDCSLNGECDSANGKKYS